MVGTQYVSPKLDSTFQHPSHPMFQKNIHTRKEEHANHTDHSILQTSGKSVDLINYYGPFGVLEDAYVFQREICFVTSYVERNWGKLMSWDDFPLAGVPERAGLIRGQV